MPAKNRIKQYEENGWYHIYNRGVEKQKIFRDEQDYAVFLSYLKTYLEPKDENLLQKIIASSDSPWREKDNAIKLLRLNNFHDELTLLAHCLMPNHFHFLVHQKSANTIDQFLNSLGTRFTMYFNKKYKRVGPMFQGVYKAVLITTTEQLLYLTRYIHRNPYKLVSSKNLASQGQALRSWKYSSYNEYLALRQTSWIKPGEILSQFGKSGKTSYQNFVEGDLFEEDSARIISESMIDSEN